jgi:hypothetical protein
MKNGIKQFLPTDQHPMVDDLFSLRHYDGIAHYKLCTLEEEKLLKIFFLRLFGSKLQ